MSQENQKDEKNEKQGFMICCGDDADFCKDFSCKVEETDNGVSFTVTSDDPEKVEKLKAKMKSCCDSSDSESCC